MEGLTLILIVPKNLIIKKETKTFFFKSYAHTDKTNYATSTTNAFFCKKIGIKTGCNSSMTIHFHL